MFAARPRWNDRCAMPDAVVIGAGPNGLVAANVIADGGWSVLVLEEQAEPGGAVKTAELTEPGFRHDVFSAFYPLAAASPALRALELERYGLRWRRAPLVLAHPASDGTCVSLSMDLEETCASLGADGDAWRRLYGHWQRVGADLLDALARPLPPVVPSLRLLGKLRGDVVPFARFALLPLRRLADEHFAGAGGARLLAGNALHTDLTPEQPLSGFFGWLLTSLGQQVGFPVPEGGAGELTAALVRRLEERGGVVRCDARVDEVVTRRSRAVGVRLADGELVAATRAVLADVGLRQLHERLLGRELREPFELDSATFKVDWALDGPIPWTARDARRASVVHVADSLDELTVFASELSRALVPTNPVLDFGQYSMADPSRMPSGKEIAWAYTHVPQGVTDAWSEAEIEAFVVRIEERIEALAPGFRALIRARHVLTPAGLEARDRNLEGGAINAGTAQLHQQLFFRPLSSLGRPTTAVRRLYLASAAVHPGGGVHGLCGWNAAHVALRRV
jgi:phytoene dehydrogenase-like protein